MFYNIIHNVVYYPFKWLVLFPIAICVGIVAFISLPVIVFYAIITCEGFDRFRLVLWDYMDFCLMVFKRVLLTYK